MLGVAINIAEAMGKATSWFASYFYTLFMGERRNRQNTLNHLRLGRSASLLDPGQLRWPTIPIDHLQHPVEHHRLACVGPTAVIERIIESLALILLQAAGHVYPPDLNANIGAGAFCGLDRRVGDMRA